MHTKYTKLVLFAAAVTALTSCSTAYKMGQTPDDVYYSPAKPQSESVASNDRDDSYYSANPRNNRYNNNIQQYSDPYYSGYDMYRNDRFLRLGIGNQYRWNGFSDYLAYDGLYNYNRFNTYSDFSFGSPYNSYSYWNSFYNPYSSFNYGYGSSYFPNYGGGGIIIGGGSKYPTASYAPAARPRPFNAAGYSGNTFSNNNRYLNTNTYTNTPNSGGRYNNTNSRNNNSNSYYNNSNNNSSRANSYRSSAPSNSNNSMFNNNSNSNNSSRSYAPASSSGGGSSSGGSSGGGGAVSRPTRGGN